MSWEVGEDGWLEQPERAPASEPIDGLDQRILSAMTGRPRPTSEPAAEPATPDAEPAPEVSAPAPPAEASAPAPPAEASAPEPPAEASAPEVSAPEPPAEAVVASADAATGSVGEAAPGPAVAAPAAELAPLAEPGPQAADVDLDSHADAPGLSIPSLTATAAAPPVEAAATPDEAPGDPEPSEDTDPAFHIPNLSLGGGGQPEPTSVEQPSPEQPSAAEAGAEDPPADAPAAESDDAGFVIPSLTGAPASEEAEAQPEQPVEVESEPSVVIPTMVAAAPAPAPVEDVTTNELALEDEAPAAGESGLEGSGQDLPGQDLPPGVPEGVVAVDSGEVELIAEGETADGLVMPNLARSATDEPPADASDDAVIPSLTQTQAEEAEEAETELDHGDGEEVEELLTEAPEVEEVDAEALDLDDVEVEQVETIEVPPAAPAAKPPAPAPAPTAKPPAPPPEKPVRRRKGWYDDVFAEHFLFLSSPTAAVTARHDAEFIHAQLGLPEGASVLDVGCGDGRVAIELAKLGLEVTGLDNSLALLLAAAQNKELAEAEEHSVEFIHGDMRRLPRDREFDAVICVGSTLGYFEEEQNRQCLQEMAGRLVPGGKLLLHVFNRDFVAPHLPSRSWWQGRRCMVIDEAEMNFFANRLRVHRTVIFDDGRQYEHYMFMRAYTVQDLGKAMSSLGMRVLDVSGSRDTSSRFYGSASPDIWIVAERK